MNLQADRIAGLCDALQLGWVAAEFDAIAQRAAAESLTFSDFLEQVLRVEVEGRWPAGFLRTIDYWRTAPSGSLVDWLMNSLGVK